MSLFNGYDQQIVLWWSEVISRTAIGEILAIVLAIFGVYVIPISWVISWFFISNRERGFLLSAITAGIIAWQGINNLLKLIHFQARPVHELPLQELLFSRPDNSFPSDHTAFVVGIAFFFLLQKEWRVGGILLFLAVIVSCARIGVAVHYPSDILFGLFTGGLGAIIISLLHPTLNRLVWSKMISLAKALHLA